MTPQRAVPADIPMLMAMARQEHALSQFANIPFDDARAEQTFRVFIDGMATVVFITEGGFIMGMVQPLAFSRLWNAYEMAWFSEDGSGLDLLKAFTKWAVGMRAINVIVHNYAGMVPAEKFNKVLHRKGFKTLGASYSKHVGEI
jgi:hypothetical protein